MTHTPNIVKAEFDYCTVDTRAWLDQCVTDSICENVTEHWLNVAKRYATVLADNGETIYTSTEHQQVSRAITERLIKRNEHNGQSYSAFTGNYDNNLSNDIAYDIVERTDNEWGGKDCLVFVEFTNGYSSYGFDMVLRVFGSEAFTAAWQIVSPQVGYYCQHCQTFGTTDNGGYSFDTDNGTTVRDTIKGEQAHCPQCGRFVALYVDPVSC